MHERYQLLEMNGDSGIGLVIRAYDTRRKQEVVMKFAKRERIEVDPPLKQEATSREVLSRFSLATISLRFCMSHEGDHVGLDVVYGGHELRLGTKTRFDVLAHLAQARWRDAQNSGLPEADHGWYDMQDLMRHLGTSEQYVNVLIHRIRRAFSDAGIEGAEGIVERRPKQLRLGTARIMGFGA